MATVVHADDNTFADEVLASDIPVVVDFWAEWCGPCHMVAPELEELARAHDGSLKVVKVNVDDAPASAARYGVRGIPTVALFREGNLTATSIGAKPRSHIEAELGLAA